MYNIEKIITDEKYNLELKEQVNFDEPKKYLKVVSSFANSYDIGYIIFGVEDGTKKIIGVKNVKESYEEISNRIKSRIEPNIIPVIDIVNFENKKLIIVKVIPGSNTPYYYVNKGNRIAYIRKGDQDCECTSLELNELILRGKNIGWDEQISDNKYGDFSFNTMKKYFKEIKGYDIDKESLISFNLLKNDKLTNAALLLSDQNPNIQSFISCTRWNGLEKVSAKDDMEFYGSILQQIDQSVDFLKKHMSNGWKIVPTQIARKEIPEYDLESFREGIINAEVHRNYLMRGTQVQVDMYDDRICISSEGGLDYGKTLQEIITRPTSKRRNPLICDIFSRLDYMERRGSGIVKINKAYEKDEKKPKFELIGQTFTLTLYSRLYSSSGINDEISGINDKFSGINDEISGINFENKLKEKYPELKSIFVDILNLIQINQHVRQNEISKKLNKTESAVYKNIKQLKDLGILERVGSNKKGYWRINL